VITELVGKNRVIAITLTGKKRIDEVFTLFDLHIWTTLDSETIHDCT